MRRQPHGQREIHFTFVDARDFLSANRGLNDGIHIADGDAVARRLGAIDLDDQVRLAEQIECACVSDARHLGELVLHRFRQALELSQITAEDLD